MGRNPLKRHWPITPFFCDDDINFGRAKETGFEPSDDDLTPEEYKRFIKRRNKLLKKIQKELDKKRKG